MKRKPPPVRTVWLSDQAWENFLHEVPTTGLTQRSVLEAALECVMLFCTTSAERAKCIPEVASPALDEAVARGWEVAQAIEEERRQTGRRHAHRISARVDSTFMERLRKGCLEPQNVGLSSVVGAVFTRWGLDWGTPEARQARRDTWVWAVKRARARDAQRRYGQPEDPLGHCSPPVAIFLPFAQRPAHTT